MIAKIVLALTTAAIAFASQAGHYRITLLQSSVVNGTELKAGEYKLDLEDNKAVFHYGKKDIEAPATIQTGDQKFASTTFKYNSADGKYQLREIRLGGSKTTVVFQN